MKFWRDTIEIVAYKCGKEDCEQLHKQASNLECGAFFLARYQNRVSLCQRCLGGFAQVSIKRGERPRIASGTIAICRLDKFLRSIKPAEVRKAAGLP